MEFDVLPHPQDFTDLEHAIVFLTVRFLKAEAACFRCVAPEVGYWAIDYSRVSELSVRNVKELARYIDAHIGDFRPAGPRIPRLVRSHWLRFRVRSLMAGIRKVRGRKPKNGGVTHATVFAKVGPGFSCVAADIGAL